MKIIKYQMPTITFDLQSGFNNDSIVIMINDVVVYSTENITTKLLLSYADSISLEVEKEKLNIEISIPERKILKSFDIKMVSDLFIGISMINNTLDIITREKPFWYG